MIRALSTIIILPFLALFIPRLIWACDYGESSPRFAIDGQDISVGFDFAKHWQGCQLGFQCTIVNSAEYFFETITEFSDTLVYPWDEFVITIPDDIDPNEVIISCQTEKSTITVEKPDVPVNKPISTKKLVLTADSLGGYRTEGKINGKKVNFIIDTGASLVAMSKSTAQRLKLKYDKTRPIRVQTASGLDRVYLTTIKKISIGKIVLRDIEAAVSTHDFPKYPLLGMSFLGKIELIQQDKKLILKKKSHLY